MLLPSAVDWSLVTCMAIALPVGVLRELVPYGGGIEEGAPGYGGETPGLEKGGGVVPVLFPPGGVGQYGGEGGQNAGAGRDVETLVFAPRDYRIVMLNFQTLEACKLIQYK